MGALDEQGLEGELTAERAAMLVGRIADARAVINRAERMVKAWGADHPFPLPNGEVYGAHESAREELVGPKVHQVLESRFGREVADKAVELSATKTQLREVLRPLAAEQGLKLAPLERQVLAEVRKVDGVVLKVSRTVGPHRAELVAANEAAS